MGIVSALSSAAAMCTSMVMMYLGMNIGIVIFFIACPVLVFGIFIAQSAKQRILYAIDTGTKPIPMFWHIRYAILVAGEFISKNGLWRFILITTTAISLIVTLILSVICGHYYLERDDILRNIDYLENETLYQDKYEQWIHYQAEGNQEASHSIFEEMQVLQENNAKSKLQIYNYTQKLDEFKTYATISGILTTFFGVIFTVSIIKGHRSKKEI